MPHPLTDIVKNILTDRRVTIDRYDVAIALGAPNEPAIWGAYLAVASDILAAMSNEGALAPTLIGPGQMVFGLPHPARPYKSEELNNG